MRKILSIVIIIAMALSCISMVTFAEGSVSEPETTSFDENALNVTERSSSTSGPSQDITARLEKGTYLYTAYVRLTKKPTTAMNISIGIELKSGSAGVGWPGVGISISDTEWHKISGTVNINKDFDKAVTFINSGEGSETSGCDIQLDAVYLIKIDENGLYGENIILNPTMEYNETGATPEWGLYRVATVVNTGYETEDSDNITFSGIENADGTITYANGYVPVTDKNIVYSGRFYDKDGSKQAAFESYVEIKFTGTSIELLTPASGGIYVEVDGQLSHIIYNLATDTLVVRNLKDGEHTLKLIAGAQTSLFTISGFKLDKNAKTMPIAEPKKIEFIGDSISEGYVNSADKLSDLDGNSYLNSFTLKTGRLLNKEYGWSFNTVAFGGIGMLRRNNGDPLTMPERYFTEREYVASTDGSTKESALLAAGTYKNITYIPDYIVINMGTNDSGQDSQRFIETYVNFIKKLKETYPDVTIFCMTPFKGIQILQIKSAVATFKAEDRVYLIDSTKWNIPAGADCLHPAPASLDIAAEKLFNVIKDYVEKGIEPENEPYINGMQFNVTRDLSNTTPYYLGRKINLTADKNGCVERTYTVYNVGEHNVSMNIRWQTSDWKVPKDSTYIAYGNINKGDSIKLTLKIKLDENGLVTLSDGTKVELSSLIFRTDFGSGTLAGSSYVMVPDDLNDLSVLKINSCDFSNTTNARGSASYNTIRNLPGQKIMGASIDIGASLTLNYYAQLSDNADAVLKITHSGETKELTGAYDDKTGYYVYKYTGINPQCMSDIIKAELIYNGTVLDIKEEYSIKAYCESQIKKSAGELKLSSNHFKVLKKLLADMLVYGTASQEYRGYNVENPADDSSWVNEFKTDFCVPFGVRKVTGNKDSNNKAKSVGLNMANVNKIYFTFIAEDDTTVKLNGNVVDKSKLLKSNGQYTLYTDGILATQFDKVYTLELIKGEDVVTKVEYNVNAYIEAKYNTEGLKDIVQALSKYGNSALKYLNYVEIDIEGDFDLEEDIL